MRTTTPKSKAFTLAEILITLAVIGVVAALTIPNLISEYQEKVYLEQFKKAYAEVFQAYKLSALENGAADSWETDQDIYNNMKPYFKIAKDCPKTIGCFAPSYKGLKGETQTTSYYNSNNYKIVTISGLSILFAIDSSDRLIYIDTNGTKAPNRFGYDLFIFGIERKNNSPSMGRPYSDSWPTTRYCSLTQDASGWLDGGACSRWILKNWNMDYLHREITSSEW